MFKYYIGICLLAQLTETKSNAVLVRNFEIQFVVWKAALSKSIW